MEQPKLSPEQTKEEIFDSWITVRMGRFYIDSNTVPAELNECLTKFMDAKAHNRTSEAEAANSEFQAQAGFSAQEFYDYYTMLNRGRKSAH